MAGLLLVISGPSSGAGKDSVTREVEKKSEFVRIVTYTTREVRPGEVAGVDYHFINREEFLRKKEKEFFLETNEYLGNFYGTPKEEVLKVIRKGQDVLLRVDVNGAKAVKEQIPEAILIFIVAPFSQMRKRLIRRAREDKMAIEEKMEFARREMKEKKYFDYVVVNREGKLEEAVEEILEIIQKKKNES